MRWRDKPHPTLRWMGRQLRFFLVLLFSYLVQVCLLPYVRILNVTPNLLLAVMAIIIVGKGRMRGLWTGMIFGILLEVMQPTQALFNLLLYPVAAIFGWLLVYTKTEEQLEYDRSVGKSGRNTSPWIRTPACAAAHVAVYEIVNLVFVYLRSGALPRSFLLGAFVNLVLTVLLSVLLMRPIRAFLGIRTPVDPAEAKPVTPYLH